jgi:hypothetical protein
MANKRQMLDKVARNLAQMGITSSRVGDSVVVDNGANPLTVSYVDASIQKPMGGIDNTVSPFLGIGVANPGKILLKSTGHVADTIADVIDSHIACVVLHEISGFANNILIENGNAGFADELQGHADLLGMGQ